MSENGGFFSECIYDYCAYYMLVFRLINASRR